MPWWRLAVLVAACAVVPLTGCAVSTWGGSYHVLIATPDQIVIEYDRVLTNPSMLMPIIAAHCSGFGKQPYLQNVSRTMGLGTVQADCR
jgi:hypothetical protein